MAHNLIQQVECTKEMRALSEQWGRNSEYICFVPTMGALHSGHISLIEQAKNTGLKTVVSIFINPKQFNVASDLESYPKNLEEDLRILRDLGVDIAFTPSSDDIYPPNFHTEINVAKFSEGFEGSGRPGHFTGVATVVSVLFNIVSPKSAIFGEKDFQQLRVIEQMVHDLHLPVEILRAPLVRDSDGLAMSSRNVKLSPGGREDARTLSQSLFAARDLYLSGERESDKILQAASRVLESNGNVQVQYLSLVNEESFDEVSGAIESPSRLLLTANVDGVRLLDNVALGE